MNASVERLVETGSALRQALERQDWSAIGELDSQCRAAVEAAMQEPLDDQALMRQRLEELMMLYRELVGGCQRERQRLAGELVQLNHSQQGARLYQLFG